MIIAIFFFSIRRPPRSTRPYTLFPYTTLFRSHPEKLTAFKAKGGKVISWHGIADPGIPVSEIITPYQDLQQSVPASRDFARLFLSPATSHCGRGTVPHVGPHRALETVIDWSVRGLAPATVLGTVPNVALGYPESKH